MKKLLLSIITLCAISATSFAQQFILSGKITNDHKQPLKAAQVKVTGATGTQTVKTDKDGLYYTSQLPAGDYDVTIINGNHTYLSQVTIAPTAPVKRFYNFQIKGKKAILTASDEDVFMAAGMARAKNSPGIDVLPGRYNVIRIKPSDSTQQK